jgi:hypothetical protein
MTKARYPFGYWRDIRRAHDELVRGGVDATPSPDATKANWQDFRQSWDAWLYTSPGQESVPPTTFFAHWAGSIGVREHLIVDAGVLMVDTALEGVEAGNMPTSVSAQRQMFYYARARLRGLSLPLHTDFRAVSVGLVDVPLRGQAAPLLLAKLDGADFDSLPLPSQENANTFYEHMRIGASDQAEGPWTDDASGPGQSGVGE